ncbi:hypothetical protein MP638_003008 [Amoeboaphelidium occidentale]|nr:hypothetical protein MP638_003008 [Amoeboaphelidium occidentale]
MIITLKFARFVLILCVYVALYASVDIESVVKHEEEDLAKFYSDVWNDLKTKPVRPFTVARRNDAVDGLGSLADLDSQPVYIGEQYDISFALPKIPLKQFITVRIEAASAWARLSKRGVFLCQMNFLEYLDLYKTSRGLQNNLIYETEHGAIYNLVLDLRKQHVDGDLEDQNPNKLVTYTKYRVVYEAWDNDPSQPMSWYERFRNWYSMKRSYSTEFVVLPKVIELSKEWFFHIFGGKTLQTLLDNKFLFSGHVYSLAGSEVSLDDIYESRDFKEWKQMALNLAKFLKNEIIGNVNRRDTPAEVIRRAGVRARKFAIAMSLSEEGGKVLEVLGNILSNSATSVMLSDTVFQQADKNGRRQLLNLNLRELLLRNRVVRKFFGEDDPLDAPMKTVIDTRTQQNRLQRANFWFINKKSIIGKQKINTFYTLQENEEFVENSRKAGFMILKKEIKTLVVCATYILWKEVREKQNSQFQLLYSAALNSAGYRFTLQAKYIEMMAKKKISDAKKAQVAAASQKLTRNKAFKRVQPTFGFSVLNGFAKSRIFDFMQSLQKNKKNLRDTETSFVSEDTDDTARQEPDPVEAMPETVPENANPQATDSKKKKKGFKKYYDKLKKALK